MKRLLLILPLVMVLTRYVPAAALGTEARSSIPADIQQIISVDYRTMSNSSTAMALKKKVLPDELKKLESAIRGIGISPEQDIDQLVFASFRTKNGLRTVGIAEGQFENAKIFATLKKQKVAPQTIDKSSVYPMGESAMLMTLLDQTTMLFGEKSALQAALDARIGEAQSLNSNTPVSQLLAGLESEPVWSVLDQVGTQVMLKSALGEASQLADFEQVKKRLLSSRYTMNFNNGVDFKLTVNTSDTMTGATMSSLIKAGMLFKKTTASATEKSALDNTEVDSDSGTLTIHYQSDDSKFLSLLNSDLFQAVSQQ